MDWLSFTSNLVDSLAWPLAAILIVLMLREPIARLVPLMRSLRYGDLELNFGREIDQLAEDLAAEEPDESTLAQSVRLTEQGKLHELALISPKAAIIEAYRRLEGDLAEAGRMAKLDLAPAVWSSPMVLGAFLRNEGRLSEVQYQSLIRLKELRNTALHSADKYAITCEEAIGYIDVVTRLRSALSAARS